MEEAYRPGIRLSCYYAPQVDGLQFWMVRRDYPGGHLTKTVAHKVEFKELEESDQAIWVPPTFVMSKEEAKNLMDDLWHAGIRPSDVGDHGQTLSAVKAHLDDMRRLLWHFIPPKQNQGTIEQEE